MKMKEIKMAEKNRFEICPYCGGDMMPYISEPESRNYNRYAPSFTIRVFFKCFECGSESPSVRMSPSLINKEELIKQIENMTDEIRGDREEEEENDNE